VLEQQPPVLFDEGAGFVEAPPKLLLRLGRHGGVDVVDRDGNREDGEHRAREKDAVREG
jgi:hypothetical protein